MASNSFGTQIVMTTFGESHGKGVGAIIDGLPSHIPLFEEEMKERLIRRRPGGHGIYTSTRIEEDIPEFLSGVFEGKSTGAPIAIWIPNKNYNSKPYEEMKSLFRPGHASYTYHHKYGHWDYRGGGRASARETAARVAASYCVEKWLEPYGIKITAWLSQVGDLQLSNSWESGYEIHERKRALHTTLFSPDADYTSTIIKFLEMVVEAGDSVGGSVTCKIDGLPVGVGEPMYRKLESCLASGMLSIPASKGFEIGEGFHSAAMKGSEYTDPIYFDGVGVRHSTNRAGGILGGISTSESVIFRVPFKPASSIKLPIQTVDSVSSESVSYRTPTIGQHDPCVAIRAVPVVEAMAFLVIGDLFSHTFIKK